MLWVRAFSRKSVNPLQEFTNHYQMAGTTSKFTKVNRNIVRTTLRAKLSPNVSVIL